MSDQRYKQASIFTADGVLFDMVSRLTSIGVRFILTLLSQDGTLTDSIAAVEAAWTAKAEELGLEPEAVIKATHGRRASDNLTELVPGLRKEHVERVEQEVESEYIFISYTAPCATQLTALSRIRKINLNICRHPSLFQKRFFEFCSISKLFKLQSSFIFHDPSNTRQQYTRYLQTPFVPNEHCRYTKHDEYEAQQYHH